MPPRPLPYREVKRRLMVAGFSEVSQRGSHVKFAKQTPRGLLTAVVPRHREVEAGTIRSILRQAAMTWEEFEHL